MRTAFTQALPCPRKHLLAVFGLVLLGLTSCASSPQLGLRKGFPLDHPSRAHIAVASFYSTDHFSLGDDRLAQLHERYETGTTQHLARVQGFRVVEPHALRHQLQEAGMLQAFDDAVSFEHELDSAFEPLGTRQAIESIVLHDLWQKQVLPTPFLLFGEVVYHDKLTCLTESEVERPWMVVERHGRELPSPCLVTHLQAKLVDASTGRTGWYNRFLLEVHAEVVTPELEERAIRRTIEVLLSGEYGLRALAPRQ